MLPEAFGLFKNIVRTSYDPFLLIDLSNLNSNRSRASRKPWRIARAIPPFTEEILDAGVDRAGRSMRLRMVFDTCSSRARGIRGGTGEGDVRKL